MGSWSSSPTSSDSRSVAKTSKSDSNSLKTCNSADPGWGGAQPLKIPEKFLLFAIMVLNSLMVFLEVLLSYGTPPLYTHCLTTRILSQLHKVVPWGGENITMHWSYLAPFVVIWVRSTLFQFNTSPINIEPLVTSVELGVGAHEYSLTCQILIDWKHHAICWLVWPGKCMWRPFADWLRIGVVSVISAWSLHALLAGKCWGAENNKIDVVLAIAGQLHAKEMSNSSTCYTLPSQTMDRPSQLPLNPSMRARQFYKSKNLFKESKNGEV